MDDRKKLKSRYNLMIARCYNEKAINYKYYGKKGIKICDEWLNSFEKFYEWATVSGFKEELSIDRIDGDKDYSPENCRWVTKSEQCYNRDMSVKLTLNGKTMYMTEWAEELNIDKTTLSWRYNQGWSHEKILTTKTNDREVKITYNNETRTMSEWAVILGVPKSRLSNRKFRGWTDKEIIEGKRENPHIRAKVFLEYDGERKSLKEWSDILGVEYKTLHYRYIHGWDNKEVLFGRQDKSIKLQKEKGEI